MAAPSPQSTESTRGARGAITPEALHVEPLKTASVELPFGS